MSGSISPSSARTAESSGLRGMSSMRVSLSGFAAAAFACSVFDAWRPGRAPAASAIPAPGRSTFTSVMPTMTDEALRTQREHERAARDARKIVAAPELVHADHQRREHHRHHDHEDRPEKNLSDGPQQVSARGNEPRRVGVRMQRGPQRDSRDERHEQLVVELHY